MSLRTRRQLLGGACVCLMISIGGVGMWLGEWLGVEELIVVSGLAVLAYIVALRLSRFPWRVQSWIIRDTRCLECGQRIDLVDNWRCGCGYVTWRPRHLFSPCPHCRKVFRWLICTRCQATISF